MTKLSFRIDDVTEAMDWERFEKCKQMLNKFGVKPLLGVVPNCKDDKLKRGKTKKDFWPYIYTLQNEGYKIAQHGYEHQYEIYNSGIFPVKSRSEFAGLNYESQYNKIKSGKKILDGYGIQTNIFMSPGHTYDINTIKAMVDNNFLYMTDGFSKMPYYEKGIIFLPVCISIRRVEPLIKRWKQLTVVLHTNDMTDDILAKYERICQKYQRHLCNYSDLCEEYEIKDKKSISEEKREFLILKSQTLAAKIFRKAQIGK